MNRGFRTVWGVLAVGWLCCFPQDSWAWATFWPSINPLLGNHSDSEVTLEGDFLYVTFADGGTYNKGAFQRITRAGTAVNVVPFGTVSNGVNNPVGSLMVLNSNFYSLASAGGVSNWGVLYSMPLSGPPETILRHFTGGSTNGASPAGSLMVNGNMLYGMTYLGGSSNRGLAFSYNTGLVHVGVDRFKILHHFTGGTNDGAYPYGGLTLVGTNLYGLTPYGGAQDFGVLFRMQLDGSNYTNLHTFANVATNGVRPFGSLIETNGMLYGYAQAGGSNGYGIAFSYRTGLALLGASRFTILHHFASEPNDGKYPQASLALSGTNLYGFTTAGGSSNLGMVFGMHLDGSGYTNLQSMLGTGSSAAAGSTPFRSPLVLGGYLFGTCYLGGSISSGNVFRLALPNQPKLFFQAPDGLLANWTLNPTGGVVSTSVMDNTGGWALKAAGDIDGDGVADLLFQDASHNTGGWLMNLDGTHRSASFWWPTSEWEIKACADYDGLGLQFGVFSRAQVIFQRPSGTVARWLLNPDGTFSNALIIGEAGGWPLRGACDLNLNGKADLLFQNASGLLVIWYHNDDDTITGQVWTSTAEWALNGTVDVDGDTVPDLIWQTPDSRTGGWLMNTNLTAKAASFWWPTGGWRIKAAGR